jgi:predicted transcriptional regulator
MANMVLTSFRLDPIDLDRLKKIATARNMTLSDLMRKAISEVDQPYPEQQKTA